MSRYKYSIWEIVHESIYIVNLVKKEDTNSDSRVDKMNDGVKFAASFYREEDEINAEYVQCFPAN